jgi:PAS domain S-box-containing protein
MTRAQDNEQAAATLAAIVESADDAIVGKTLDGVITSWNRAAETMYGYTAAEAIGRHITLIIPRDRWAEEDEVLARIRRGERVDHFETVRVARDGRTIDVSLTMSPIIDSQGRIVGVSKIARDISERRRVEQERADLLAREQAARAEAEALNRSKDQFLAVLSHELRTPMNAIYGWAQMLATGQLDPAVVARASEAIVRNAGAQVQLIEDLLDVSRIITGNMRLDVQPVDLRLVIEAALDAVRPAANAKAVHLHTVLDPRAGPVIGAPDRLKQVVWNLLINAVKFTPKGGRVHVGLQRVNSHVEIVVADTGEGISADVLPYIFDRFRQGDSSSTRAHGGLGIGLALVRHLVELHGGTVRAESGGPGQGATFTVSLPVAIVRSEARTATPLPAAGGVQPGEAKPLTLRGLKILVVDDDLDGLELAAMVLTSSGAEIKTCTSAAAAREILDDWTPDVLLTDLEMPGEDGFDLLKSVRGRSAGRMPAVALTAYGRPEDRIRVLEAGFNLHVIKPVDPTELCLAVASVAGRTG